MRPVLGPGRAPGAAGGDPGVPAARGVTEVPAPDHGRGRVGGGGGVGQRSDGAVSVLPRGRRRCRPGRAGRPRGHGAAATRRRVSGCVVYL